ncbi:MAG TPA: ATP-binding protein [Stellaceae bacterium]|jgi:signal transduction histidine kinase|nr:ATP-binding protein [Stellaceae bacterium]
MIWRHNSTVGPLGRHNLVKHIILGVGGIVIALMWLAVLVSAQQAQQAAVQQARSNSANLAAAFSEEVSHTLDGISGVMEAVAARMRAKGSSFDIHDWAGEIPLLSQATIQGSIIGPDGYLKSTTLGLPPEPVNLSDREHFRIHLDGGFPGVFISKPVIGRVSGQASIQISRRVDNEDGKFLGVIVFSVAPANLTSLVSSIDIGTDGTIALVGLDDVVRARFSKTHPDGLDGVGESIAGTPRPAAVAPGEHGFYTRMSVIDGIARLFAYQRLKTFPLVVTVGIPLTDVFAASAAHTLTLFALAAAATLLLVILGLYLIRESRFRALREIELADQHAQLEAINSELVASKEMAEAASRAKSVFLANMTHELRTPLNAIIGFSQLIKDQVMGPIENKTYPDYATDIFLSGQRLLTMINNVLDLSRIDAGGVVIEDDCIGVGEILNKVAGQRSADLERKRLVLALDIADGLPQLRADRLKLKQVLANLLANAIKFSQEGGRIVMRAAIERGGDLVLTIVDQGIGMMVEDISVALQHFEQVDGTLTKRYEGLGAGLPLAKRLIELHGGAIAIESTQGVGTTVRVTLPRERLIALESLASAIDTAA